VIYVGFVDAMSRDHDGGFLKYAPEEAKSRLIDRQRGQLEDLIHDFAFAGRKAAELAARENFPSAQVAREKSLPCSRQIGADWPEEMFSLVEVFGRIIHSDRFSLDRSNPYEPESDRLLGDAFWAFSVASDRDQNQSSSSSLSCS
jgi:hypothetical protein